MDEEAVEEWLRNNDEFARNFVEDYLHSHSLFMKELIQEEMDKRQQQMQFYPISSSGLAFPNLTASPSSPQSSLKHVTSSPNSVARRKSTQQLRQLSKQELLMELLKDVVSPDFNVNSMSHKFLVNVLVLTNADRSSLFLVEGSSENPILVSRLFDVTENSTLELVIHDESEAIKIPFGTGIVGKVAATGVPIVLEDAYEDSRFNTQVDNLTGYRTKAIMCLPIKTSDGQVIGVAQVINKKGGIRGRNDYFTKEDENVFRTYLAFCAIGLINAYLFDQSFVLSQQLHTLLHLAKGLFEDATSLPNMIKQILSEAQELIPCQKALVLLLGKTPSNEGEIVFDQAFELNSGYKNSDDLMIMKPSEVTDLELASMVAKTKKFISTSDASHQEGIQIYQRSSSILCMPILDNKQNAIGVIVLKDKLNGLPFNKTEEDAFHVFGTFCGLGVQNVLNYEEILKANAKQSVALEVLSFHAAASDDDVNRIMQHTPMTPESISLQLFDFNDLPLSEDETVLASVRMFMDLGLVGKFHIDIECLYKWVLTVRKNYRPVTYHNWRHAFNVAQSMYSMIITGGMDKRLSDTEQLGLVIACLCHDLDHRGTNNAFQAKSASPLAQLYSTSTMEHHHLDHCIMILNSDGNRILSHVSTEQYQTVIRILEHAILSTDLALYFKKKGQFVDLVQSSDFDWKDTMHKEILRGMMMTACDVGAITKPWPIQQRVAELVASEFFEQGDRERNDLNLEPIAMMDRRKKDELPKMQVGFIDAICLALYEVLQTLEPGLTPLYEGCLSNRGNWQSLAENKPLPQGTNLLTATPTATPTQYITNSNTDINGSTTQHIQEDTSDNEHTEITTNNKKKCTIG